MALQVEIVFILFYVAMVVALIAFNVYVIGLVRGSRTPAGRARIERFIGVARRIFIVGVVGYAIFVALVVFGILPGPIM